MRDIDRNALQSDIRNAIEAVRKHDITEDPTAKAAFLSGFLGRKYPEILVLLRYIADMETAP